LLGEGLEGSCCAVHGGVSDGEDGDHYYCVHDGVEALDAGGFDSDDEGGGFGVYAVAADELGVSVGDEQADDGY
jgi:hypothetical protein